MKRILGVVLFSCANALVADPLPEVIVPMLQGDVVLDGKLDDDVWERAASVLIDQDWMGRSLDTSSRATTVSLAWSMRGLLVAYECPDLDVQARNSHRDGRIWKGDVVELFVSPQADVYPYVEIQVNPDNVVFDCIFHSKPDDDVAGSYSISWNAESLRSAVSYFDGVWTVELFLSWDDLPLMNSTPKEGSRFRCQLNRYHCGSSGRPDVFHTAWSPPKGKQGYPHIVDSFGWLILGGEAVAR